MTRFAYYMGLFEKWSEKAFKETDLNLKKFFQNAAEGWKRRAMKLRLSECGEIIF